MSWESDELREMWLSILVISKMFGSNLFTRWLILVGQLVIAAVISGVNLLIPLTSRHITYLIPFPYWYHPEDMVDVGYQITSDWDYRMAVLDYVWWMGDYIQSFSHYISHHVSTICSYSWLCSYASHYIPCNHPIAYINQNHLPLYQ